VLFYCDDICRVLIILSMYPRQLHGNGLFETGCSLPSA
jgi:hypothetical protein